MFTRDQYRLLDFGDGRRLERFGPITLDRPCPAAEQSAPANPEAWQHADARFDGRKDEKGVWSCRCELPERWIVTHGPLRFELKRTEFGHLGLFPEQAESWDWLARVVSSLTLGEGQGYGSANELTLPGASFPHPLPLSRLRERGDNESSPSSTRERGDERRPLKVLNLFAYTGGSTLAAAVAGAEVTHVDAAKNIVTWARRNAELSGLADAPVRWITEDTMKFVKRELKRGNRYDAAILDPPSYGHGPRGEVWRVSKHLPRLLSLCGELTAGRRQFMLLTCHTPGYDPDTLTEMMREALNAEGVCTGRLLTIAIATGAALRSGVVVRWLPSPRPPEGDRSMFSANGLSEEHVFAPKNGPVPPDP